MKNRKLIYSLLMLVAVVMSSCFMEKTDPWAPKIQGAGTIQFQVVDGALTGTAIAGVVQPTMDVTTARFSRATTSSPNYVNGNVEITFNVSSNITGVTVVMYPSSQANPTRETKATITGSGSIKWTQAIGTLTYGGVNVSNTTYILEVTGTTTDGKTVMRPFSLVIIA